MNPSKTKELQRKDSVYAVELILSGAIERFAEEIEDIEGLDYLVAILLITNGHAKIVMENESEFTLSWEFVLEVLAQANSEVGVNASDLFHIYQYDPSTGDWSFSPEFNIDNLNLVSAAWLGLASTLHSLSQKEIDKFEFIRKSLQGNNITQIYSSIFALIKIMLYQNRAKYLIRNGSNRLCAPFIMAYLRYRATAEERVKILKALYALNRETRSNYQVPPNLESIYYRMTPAELASAYFCEIEKSISPF